MVEMYSRLIFAQSTDTKNYIIYLFWLTITRVMLIQRMRIITKTKMIGKLMLLRAYHDQSIVEHIVVKTC